MRWGGLLSSALLFGVFVTFHGLLKPLIEFNRAGFLELIEHGLQLLRGGGGFINESGGIKWLGLLWIGNEIVKLTRAVELKAPVKSKLAHLEIKPLARRIPSVEPVARRAFLTTKLGQEADAIDMGGNGHTSGLADRW